jgi:hypothetical protein
MDKNSSRLLAAMLCLAGTGVFAAETPQQPQMTPEQKAMADAYARMGELRAEHKQLEYFAGRWNVQTNMVMDPAAKPEVSSGKAETKPLFGGRSFETNYEGSYGGQTFTGRGYTGFDNLKGKFYTTWMDSMSTSLWLALGTYDAKTRSYTFTGDMDDAMKPGTIVKIREVIRIVDDKHYVFEWYETRAGKEAKTMWIEYTRA